MSKLSNMFIFALGAAIGSVATWYYTKEKYARIAQEEIDSVKETFAKKKTQPDSHNAVQEPKKEEDVNYMKYAAMLAENGYVNYNEKDKTEPKTDSDIYVIAPDVFGEIGYTEVSLTYYNDGVLVDENDEVVDDIENMIGFDSLSHFGEYEDDSVFVRNDKLKIDYEILRSEQRFSDILSKYPRHRRMEG